MKWAYYKWSSGLTEEEIEGSIYELVPDHILRRDNENGSWQVWDRDTNFWQHKTWGNNWHIYNPAVTTITKKEAFIELL